ncbi:hypothetical protein [Curtobacterium poinsettiae]|uniref:hypothetical protein n=1 Tax=Curtobacterium poinsettiae TaxID=159612 RepID=UPI00217EF022|nr:hypothetical protein [Curtobacterium flaccumfaciens]MCS6578276.1 hypothetical protein [Curtobacterium flaccumfaciens]
MTEQTVQVPVKSIEDELEYRVRTVLACVRMAEKHNEPYPRDWVNNQIGAGRERIRALLSQPTPSADPVCACGHEARTHDAMSAGSFACHVLECRCRTFTATPPRIEVRGGWFIDPSTIRDVTPPAATPEVSA